MLKVTKTITGSEPITLEQAKAWMRVDTDADDTLITTLISQVRELVEEYLNMSIIESTLEVIATPRTELEPPYGPVQTIVSVKDTDGNDLTYTWNNFVISFVTESVSVTGGESAVYVESVSTYTSGVSDIPAGLQMGLLECIAWLYENRGDSSGFQLILKQNTNLMPYRQKLWI